MTKHYKAGKYNIGVDEINYRRRIVGYGSATIATALYIILVYFNFPLYIYTLLLIPVFVSVHGFIEARNEFCTSYARSGKYNMASEAGITQNVLSQANRRKDRKYADLLVKESLKKSLVISIFLIAASRLVN